MTADRGELRAGEAGRPARAEADAGHRDRPPTGPASATPTEVPFDIVAMAPFGRTAPRLAAAAARAGALGVLDLGADRAAALAALAEVGRWWDGTFGVRVPAGCGVRPADLPDAVDTVVIDAAALGLAAAGVQGGAPIAVPQARGAAVRSGQSASPKVPAPTSPGDAKPAGPGVPLPTPPGGAFGAGGATGQADVRQSDTGVDDNGLDDNGLDDVGAVRVIPAGEHRREQARSTGPVEGVVVLDREEAELRRKAAAATAPGRPGEPVDAAEFARGRRLLIEVVDPAEAEAAIRLCRDLPADGDHDGPTLVGLIARGAEAGGRVGDLTTFVLLQRLLGDPAIDVPVWAAGGIGPHSAAAAVAGGAAGVVLDVHFALVREMDLPDDVAAALTAMDGGETRVVRGHRVYARPDLPEIDLDGLAPAEINARLGATGLRSRLLPVGQDGALAAPLAARYETAGGVIRAIRAELAAHLRAAVRARPLAPADAPPGAPAFREYPVAQAPMPGISDRSAFAAAVAQDGGLPFLAPAPMSGEETRRLLEDTADRLGDRPWGVGVLGSAPPELREEQLAAVRAVAPPFALIAGGLPAQAAALEAAGVATYLPAPSPGLLERFLAEGARRFVFEGMECGGRVGPRAAFPLWDAQVELLLRWCDDAPEGAAAELSVMFAGGVHDERSAAMVAALAGPLAARGADVRLLMGTAYLFTYEAVAAGAIVPGFQQAALDCAGTALLESSPGHATRCARTPYVRTFEETRRRLEAAGTPRHETWARLEELNLARLGVAAKGVRRDPAAEAPEPVDPDEQRREGLYTMGQAAALRSATTAITALHEQVSTGATCFLDTRAAALGVGVLDEEPDARPEPQTAPEPGRPGEDGAPPLDVAVVGIGCVFPGARDAAEYWAGIVGAAPDTGPADRGLLPDVPFDPHAHGIAPSAAADIEPVQLLALEVAAQALADAGRADRRIDRSRCSLIFGGVDAGRLAGRLGLGGFAHGAASAADALDLACQRLAGGAADIVLCGAADVFDDAFDDAAAARPTGRCAPFDAAGEASAPGEGVACVVLKRLADAERDGDRVHAVIKAVAGTGGAPAPRRPEAIRRTVRRAYARAGVSPARVGLVEAHGTGDPADDAAELQALTQVFTEAGAAPGSVTLGSVTARIGHTGGAAVLAGLIKAACALHAGVLPGAPHITAPRRDWDPETSPFVFGDRARPWPVPPAERYAGVNGAGFHAVLAARAGAPEPVSGLDAWPAELFLVRGADRAAARDRLDRLGDLAATGARLRDLARTCAADDGPVRVAIVATGPDDLRAKIAAAREFRAAPGVFTADPAAGADPGRVAFLFPGPGGMRPGALADLFTAFPRLRRLLRLDGGRHAAAMFPPAAFTPEDAGRQRAALAGVRAAQPAAGIAGLALHRLLTELGVRPDMAAGHGYGELVALCAAGVFGEDDLMAIGAARADAVLAAAGASGGVSGGADPGAMAAVSAALGEVRAALSGVGGVVVAGHDAPRRVVISGTTAAVERAAAELRRRGLAVRPVPAACAQHSPLVAGASAVLRAELGRRDLRSPAFPVWSNTTAAPYDGDPGELAATLAGQVAAPIRFVEQIEAMYAAGARVFVEAGPERGLAGLVGEILGDRPHTAVACDAPGGGIEGLLCALAGLAVAGVPVDAAALFAGRDARPVPPSAAAPGWTVNGHRVRRVDGGRPTTAPTTGATMDADRDVRPAGAFPPPAPPDADAAEAAVLEYLRATRELVAAQREVMLRFLGAADDDGDDRAEDGTPAAEPLPAEALAAESTDVLRRATAATVPEPRPCPAPEPGPQAPGRDAGRAQAEPPTPRPAPEPEPETEPETGAEPAGAAPARQVVRMADLPPLPIPPPKPGRFDGRRFLIVDDGCGIALELADLLEQQGAQVRTPLEPDAPCDGLIHLAALRPGTGPVLPGAYGGVRDALRGGLRWLVLASGSGGTFGHEYTGGVGDPTPGAGLRGLARTLAREHPETLVRAIDVDTKENPRAVAERILAELLTSDAPVEIGHDAEGRRRTLVVVPAEPPAAPAGEPAAEQAAAARLGLDRDSVVLLTGGARGITARLARELARAAGCHLELIDRTPRPPGPEDPVIAAAPDEAALRRTLLAQGARTPAEIDAAIRRILAEREVRAALEALHGTAASVRCHAVDVRDPQAVRAVVEDVYARHGRLDGVVHGAGLPADGPARDKDPEAFARVYRTQVDGARALAASVRPDLRFFVVFGGVAGVYGGPGHADHAAACDACDTLARVWRTELRGRVLVADWGPWAGDGGAAPAGVPPIDPDAAVAALLRELAYGDEVQVVFTGAAGGGAR